MRHQSHEWSPMNNVDLFSTFRICVDRLDLNFSKVRNFGKVLSATKFILWLIQHLCSFCCWFQFIAVGFNLLPSVLTDGPKDLYSEMGFSPIELVFVIHITSFPTVNVLSQFLDCFAPKTAPKHFHTIHWKPVSWSRRECFFLFYLWKSVISVRNFKS